MDTKNQNQVKTNIIFYQMNKIHKKKNFKPFEDLSKFNSGKIVASSHFYCVRIFYEDTDAGGIVYHANYLKFFERVRSSLLNYLGIDQNKIISEKGYRFVVREITLKIKGSFKLNDLVVIETRHKYAKNSCVNLEQLAWSINENHNLDELKVKSEQLIVMIDNNNKIKRIHNVLSNSFFANTKII